MEWPRSGPVGIVDGLYALAVASSVVLGRFETQIGVSMALFALLILLVDWYQVRQRERQTGERHSPGALVGLTLLILGVWVGLATRRPDELAIFFALLAGFFVLVAIRESLLLDPTALDLVLQGYASLVTVYLVLGAATNAVEQYSGALVLIAIGVYLVRNLFWWTGAALNRLVGDRGTR